jgi:hypothetical protein
MMSPPVTVLEDEAFAALRDQLLGAAARLAPDAQHLSALLAALAGDVARVLREPLHIFPVAHHSPACAVQLVRRLQQFTPKVIFIEACEDLQALLPELPSCVPPVAMQAFAGESDDVPARRLPLSVITPLTPFSAEYQAICFGLTHPDVEVVFVDRAADHVVQWSREPAPEAGGPAPAADDENERLHGGAVGVEVGDLMPTFPAFLEGLLEHSRTSSFAEWWSLYVDEPTITADHHTWRQVMVLVGALIRRLGVSPERREVDRLRERFMWTRIKDHLQRKGIAPSDALYICGAAHAVAEVPEWGTDHFGQPDDPRWEIPPRTRTTWQYGFIPSAYSAIERQFGLARGSVAVAEQSWEKALKALKLKPLTLAKAGRAGRGEGADEAEVEAPKAKARGKKPSAPPSDLLVDGGAAGLLIRPPNLLSEDHEQLLQWCTGVVAKAREAHYMASTADAIAIYQTSILLARLRGRLHPSPYDFADAAETCLDKGELGMRRSVRHLCGMVMGGDRVGRVGYATLPPLVRDVYGRLAGVGVTPGKTTITRVLLDLQKGGAGPTAVSDLLWRLRALLPGSEAVRPVTGERRLGVPRVQESWDVKLHGPALRELIELAYEGVTVEQVLERRLRDRAFAPQATAAQVLALAEDALLLADRERLSDELGARAVELIALELSAANARELFERVRRLVHHLRSRPSGLPGWLGAFVATGYQHYASLLPQGFADRGTSPAQLAGVLSFVLTLETLALSLGCHRSQVIIALRQAGPLTVDPGKLGLLWAAEWTLELKSGATVRDDFQALMDNPMSLAALPQALGSLLLALSFAPVVSGLAAELLSRAFGELPEELLLPWLPGLLDSLRPVAGAVLPALLREVVQSTPRTLAELDSWSPPFGGAPIPTEGQAPAKAPTNPRGHDAMVISAHLWAAPAAVEAWASALGDPPTWAEVNGAGDDPLADPLADPRAAGLAPGVAALRALLEARPAAAQAWAARLGL